MSVNTSLDGFARARISRRAIQLFRWRHRTTTERAAHLRHRAIATPFGNATQRQSAVREQTRGEEHSYALDEDSRSAAPVFPRRALEAAWSAANHSRQLLDVWCFLDARE